MNIKICQMSRVRIGFIDTQKENELPKILILFHCNYIWYKSNHFAVNIVRIQGTINDLKTLKQGSDQILQNRVASENFIDRTGVCIHQ